MAIQTANTSSITIGPPSVALANYRKPVAARVHVYRLLCELLAALASNCTAEVAISSAHFKQII
jgi:hypothetical protein